MSKLYNQKISVDTKKIEDIRYWYGYSDAVLFAKDCGVSYPTYLDVKKTKTSWLKFLKGLIKLVKEKENKDVTLSYFFN